MRSVLIWVFAIILTLASVYYQRKTGPTYPLTVKTELGDLNVTNRLIRTAECGADAMIFLNVPDKNVNGTIQYKRYKSHDEWIEQKMVRHDDSLVAYLPAQPPAGKIMYKVFLEQEQKRIAVTEQPVVMRFKGAVPTWVLILHIILIFMAMLFSTYTGLEALFKGPRVITYTRLTLLLLLVGGLVMGPVVQKYAFGAFWTGWPFGHDLTDNKTAVAFIFWLIAFIQQQRNRNYRAWVIVAAVVLFIAFVVPHSMWGSELDYTQQ
ncbi:MAG TPA: hypothetical protein PKH94_07650 [Bacteroidales bacterium]|nr:hypothetical protein [Bacteroidales bacterium]HNS47096.1 hypothetical protein [Bacteroidales bacterium]